MLVNTTDEDVDYDVTSDGPVNAADADRFRIAPRLRRIPARSHIVLRGGSGMKVRFYRDGKLLVESRPAGPEDVVCIVHCAGRYAAPVISKRQDSPSPQSSAVAVSGS